MLVVSVVLEPSSRFGEKAPRVDQERQTDRHRTSDNTAREKRSSAIPIKVSSDPPNALADPNTTAPAANLCSPSKIPESLTRVVPEPTHRGSPRDNGHNQRASEEEGTEAMACVEVQGVTLADAFKEFRERKLSEKKRLNELRAKAKEKKRTAAFKSHLRKKFVDQARQYLGVPYGKRFHEQDPDTECECDGCTESGRQLRDAPLFLDCCALVRKVVHDLREDFGFVLGPGNQAYQFDTLPIRVDSVDDLEEGDLIFFTGDYYR